MSNKNIILLLLLGAAIAVLCIVKCNNNDPKEPAATAQKEIQKQEAKLEIDYKKKYDSLLKRDSIREFAHVVNKDHLSAAQTSTREKEKTIAGLIWEAWETAPTNDFAGGNMKAEFDLLVHDQQASDSICNSTIANLEEISLGKDSMLTAKDRLIVGQKGLLNIVVGQQQALIDYSKALKKQVRSEKAKSWIWKAVAAGLLIFKLKK